MPHQCTGCGEVFEDGSKEMLSGCPECGGNTFQFRPKGADLPNDPDPPDPDVDDTGSDPDDPDPSGPDGDELPDRDDGAVAGTVGRATTRVRDFVSPSGEPDPNATWPSEASGATAAEPATDDGEIIDADARRDDAGVDEDDAQASARTGLASREDVRDVGEPRTGPAGSEPAESGPSGSGWTGDTGAGSDGAADGRSDRPPAGEGDQVVSDPDDEDPDLTELREQLNDQFESIKIVEPGEYELNLMELYEREEYIIALQENGRYVIQVPDQWIGSDFDDR
ncbi:hypothetical protein BRC85_00925 [Halobacteriales archaeon QS_1_69_70]|nr:MAG: hypothetical protein BRC85_00925 [Halobacteriales archaeon QS_1_69_70]